MWIFVVLLYYSYDFTLLQMTGQDGHKLHKAEGINLTVDGKDAHMIEKECFSEGW